MIEETNLRWGANNNIPLLKKSKVSAGVSCKAYYLFATLQAAELPTPLCNTLVDHLLVGLNTDRPGLLAFAPKAEQSKFSTDSLAASSRRANKDILIRCVEGLENLRLDLVECLNGG